MIHIIFEKFVESSKLPITNVSKEELMKRIVALEKKAKEDNESYQIAIMVN